MTTSLHANEDLLASVLLQVTVVVLAARCAGAIAAAARQPRAVGEIIAGLLLGPSFFGHFFPQLSATLFPSNAAQVMWVLAQVGLILLMFQIGGDFEFGHLKKRVNARAVALVAFASLAAPLATGYALGRLSAPELAVGVDPTAFSLFVAVAMAITAVPILGRMLAEYGLTRTEVGVIAISAAAINDVVGWLALAVVAAVASSGFVLGGFLIKLAALGVLMIVLWVIGRPFAAWVTKRFPLQQDQLSPAAVALVLAAILLAGIATQKIGIFTIFGGFLVGLLFHPHTAFVSVWRKSVGQFVLVFFLPIFFTITGLRTNLLGLNTSADWAWCALFFAASVISKIVPVYLAARVASFDWKDAATLGVLMNTRALMELIVLNIGLTLGVIPQDVFTMLVLMAVGTTLMAGPLLRLIPNAINTAEARIS